MLQVYDVVVLGGGIIGASTAYSLIKQGQKVLLIDQFEPGHKQGSSHGDGRVVRFNYTEAIYVEMAMQAYQAWDALSADAGERLIQQTGLLEYGPQGTKAIQVTEDILKKYDIAYERLSANEANQRFPQFRFEADSDIIFQPGGAVAFATPAVKAFWRLFHAKGGESLTGTGIQSIEVEADIVKLITKNGDTIQASKLVLAAGGWTKQLAEQLDLDLPLIVTQEILAYFPPKSDIVNHNVGTMPVMLDHFSLPNSEAQFYSLPMVDIQGVKMGLHHSGSIVNADDERFVSDDIVAALQGWVDRLYPHLEREPIDIHTCLYTNTPDYHFIIDKHPLHDNVVIAAGFSGHGFKFGPMLGDILAGLALGQDSSIPLDSFSLERFQHPQTLDKRLGA